jgi:hypothetical protein
VSVERERLVDRIAGAVLYRGVLVSVVAVVVGALLLNQAVVDDEVPAAAGGPPATVPVPADGSEDEGGPDGAEAGDPGDEPGAGSGGEGEEAAPPAPAPDEDPTPERPAPRPPSEVRVLVLNGSGRTGEAGRGAQFFTEAGYVAADPRNAPAPGPSAIYHAEGFAAEAAAVAEALGVDAGAVVAPIDPAAPPIDDLQGAAVVVVAGTDGTIGF